MLETIQELSQQRAEQFLNTFYFQYGHRSIADLAHLVFGLENISILAAMAVVDEQVWDGQERSTRYQPFRRTGWHLPEEVAATEHEAIFRGTAEALFNAYHGLSAALLEHLMDAVPRPDDLEQETYRRTLRARAFDVARALLPLASHTSVGQIVSARVAERQIGRLLSSRYAEVRAIGGELKAACQRPAEAPLLDEAQPPAAPTLVKYADASPYRQQVARDLAQAAVTWLGKADTPDRSREVALAEPASDPLDEVVATLLFEHDVQGHAYAQAQAVVADMSLGQKQEVFELSTNGRGTHDDLLREHQSGYGLIFDVLVDLGSFRDLHRHRRCVQVQQPLSFDSRYVSPEDVFVAGLGAQAAHSALEAGLAETYAETLVKAETASSTMPRGVREYLLPMAYRTRCLFKMDWAQAAYMIEQRTQPQGHFSYRRIAWAMYQALAVRWPHLAVPIRAVNPDGPLDLLRR
jgi:thymidylate synthase ThyX